VDQHSKAITCSVINWGRSNFIEYPWRVTDNIWLAIVAEMMLQRTRVKSVVPVWVKFAEIYKSPMDVLTADDISFHQLLTPLGLRWRNHLIKDIASVLVSMESIPDTKDRLQALPGIGDYISAAILSLHMGIRDILIDSNIVRWLSRMTGNKYDRETRRKWWVKDLCNRLTPIALHKEYNYGLLDLTMTICTSPPRCNECPVSKYCNYWVTSIDGCR